MIGATLLVVNVVEALIPGYFPTWTRVEMVGVAVLMAVIVLLGDARIGRNHRPRRPERSGGPH